VQNLIQKIIQLGKYNKPNITLIAVRPSCVPEEEFTGNQTTDKAILLSKKKALNCQGFIFYK
jgi:hypothetical protein